MFLIDINASTVCTYFYAIFWLVDMVWVKWLKASSFCEL